MRGVLPLSYFIFEFYRDDARAEALDYLYRHETKKGLYPIFREQFSSQETTAALRDKAQFAQRCEKHGVAAVPALFVVSAGVITRFDGGGPGLPRCDLFLKPLSGAGGRGAVVWSYLGDQSYRNAEKGLVSEAQLIAHLQAESRTDEFVGRLYVSNHLELAEVSSGALCSVRVVSCLDEQGNPEITHAVLRMARTPGIAVDNFHAGGIARGRRSGNGHPRHGNGSGIESPDPMVGDSSDDQGAHRRTTGADVDRYPTLRAAPTSPSPIRSSSGGTSPCWKADLA